MTHETSVEASDRELTLTRLIDAPREKLYRAWTEPALLKQWFAPLPWTTPHAELDVRPGGAATITMRSPDGNETCHARASISRWCRTGGWYSRMPIPAHGSRRRSRS